MFLQQLIFGLQCQMFPLFWRNILHPSLGQKTLLCPLCVPPKQWQLFPLTHFIETQKIKHEYWSLDHLLVASLSAIYLSPLSGSLIFIAWSTPGIYIFVFVEECNSSFYVVALHQTLAEMFLSCLTFCLICIGHVFVCSYYVQTVFIMFCSLDVL